MVAGGGFYSYYNLQCIKLDKENRIQEKKSVLGIQKTFNAVFKNGFNPVFGSIPRLPKIRVHGNYTINKSGEDVFLSVDCMFFFYIVKFVTFDWL